MKPKCTIYLNWAGPECGKEAVSLNSYGGFQCEEHSSFSGKKIGPVKPIHKDDPNAAELLQEAYDKYLKEEVNDD